jgi:hypothetical protein
MAGRHNCRTGGLEREMMELAELKAADSLDPDGDDSARYRLLKDDDPMTASRLMERYTPRWLQRTSWSVR